MGSGSSICRLFPATSSSGTRWRSPSVSRSRDRAEAWPRRLAAAWLVAKHCSRSTTASPQSTLGAAFGWSYDLLAGPERALLRQLSGFAGGFDAKAALAVCPAASLELLAALADRSLIVVEDRGQKPAPRFRMLETVREFA